MHNDVALIKLSRPAQLNQRVNLVCLPEPGEDEQVQVQEKMHKNENDLVES